jgi:RND superfamily putative drug exporter
VVLALLTLVLAAAPATRSLGLHAACGLLVALVFVLLVLPPLLGLFGRRLFPSGLTDPIQVIGATGRAAEIQSAITTTPGVVSASNAGSSASGLTQRKVVLDAPHGSTKAFKTVAALRDSVKEADPTAVLGGSDAQALDARDAAVRDRQVIIPAILAVVLIVLYVLRAALAPLVLVAAMVLSALSALGLGGWASVHLLGIPALDYTTPLYAFLFLVALGVDYTIFLGTRAREETPGHGTRDGIVRAVSATGPVITSAGIVLASVFCVLGVLPLIVLTQLGVIVGLGILLDTFIIRTVVIPALFHRDRPADLVACQSRRHSGSKPTVNHPRAECVTPV